MALVNHFTGKIGATQLAAVVSLSYVYNRFPGASTPPVYLEKN